MAADRRFDNQLRSANVKLLSFACTLEFQMKENGIIGCKYHIRHNARSERDSWRHNAFVSCEGEQWQRVQKTAAAGLPRDES